jgi:hypothetical protein
MGLHDSAEFIFFRDMDIRSRVHKGIFRDIIYPAMFENNFRKTFTKEEIKIMKEWGWIEKKKIQDDNGSYRTVVLWTEVELKQMEKFKIVIEKIASFFKRILTWLK